MSYRFPFADRAEAGRALAARLAALTLADPVVLALPRGGVPIAVEIARALGAPVDIVLVRKIGPPRLPEFAIAAVVDTGGATEIVRNNAALDAKPVSEAHIAAEAQAAGEENERRRSVYLAGRERQSLWTRDVVVVDDGIATGTSMRAALVAIRRREPGRIVLAVPVACKDALDLLRPLVDDIVCLETPDDFNSIGLFYDDFHQLSDAEVIRSLDQVGRANPHA